MKTKTKIKKYDLGSFVGPSAVSTSNIKTPILAKKLPNELASGPKLPGTPDATDPSGMISGVSDMGVSVLSGLSKSAIDNADPRSNPAIAMKKANTLNTGADLLGSAAKGAAMGVVGGPVGMAVGAGLGLLTTGIGKAIGAKKQKKDLADAQSGWSSDDLTSYQNAVGKTSYVKGGTIKGAGTGKSDSINMSAKNGSFIVPSENSDYGRQLGEEYLGWKPGEKAPKNDGSVDIKASNSEVIYTPDEVRILKYHGVNLDALAPKADAGEAKASGGSIHINPANKGKFTATKKKTGKSTAELTHSSNPVTKKRAIFAQNAKKWHHADGGVVDDNPTKLLSKEEMKNLKLFKMQDPYSKQYTRGIQVVDSLRSRINPVLAKKANVKDVKDVPIGVELTDSELNAAIGTEKGRKMWNENLRFISRENNDYLGNPNSRTAGKNEADKSNMADQAYGTRVANARWANVGLTMTTQDKDSKGKVISEKKGIKYVFDKDNPAPSSVYADGGPVAKTKGKASMTGALVNYMNKPKDTGASMTTADPGNVPVTQKQRNNETLTKWENDPNTMKNVVGMASMAGGIKGSTNLLNKMQTIEEIANSPRIARLGKAAQDMFREEAPKLSSDEFASHTGLAGLNQIGKYWTYGDVAKSSGYKKGGKIMKKKKMMVKKEIPKLSSGMKGKKKMTIPGDMEIPGMEAGGPIEDLFLRDSGPSKVKTFKPKVSNVKLKDKPSSTLSTIKPKSPTADLNIGFPEIAAGIQAAGGAYGLATAKKAPDIGVSETLKNLSADVRKQAAYGLEPAQLDVLNNSVERSRRDTNRFITESGGSGQEIMSKLNTTLGTTIAGKENIAFQDAAEKARKFSNVIGVDTQVGGQEFDVKRMRREDWYKNQDMFASLLSTGIENIIGARQFKSQQKMMSERDNRAVFSLKTT